MVDDNAPFRHHLFEITKAERVSEIPADTLSDNIDGIMQANEGFSDQSHGQVTSQKKQHVTEQRLNATEPSGMPGAEGRYRKKALKPAIKRELVSYLTAQFSMSVR